MILIGSRALKYWYPDLQLREGADWDIIDSASYYSRGDFRVEVHPERHLNNERVFDFMKYDDSGSLDGPGWVELPDGREVSVAPLNVLAAIKRSHLWRDYQWDKHITHYNKYLRQHLDDSVQDFLKERTKLTKEAYPQGNPSLNQSNEDFFDDAVAKVYDHDFIHELAAYYDQPLYTRLKRDDSKAWCEKDLWEALSLEDKQKCVAEECYVIATERFLVRNNWNYSYKGAYLTALKKVCTTLTSGWFRDFAIDNHPEIMALFDANKLNSIKENLK